MSKLNQLRSKYSSKLGIFAIILVATELSSVAMAMEVVIVGGGPVGLASATATHKAGHNVTVVEERDYNREQVLFMNPASCSYLETLGLENACENLYVFGLNKQSNGQTSLIHTNKLQNKLKDLATKNGVTFIHAKFEGFSQGNRKAIQTKTKDGEEIEIPYDILVGADGKNSAVRKSLNIEPEISKTAHARAALYRNTANQYSDNTVELNVISENNLPRDIYMSVTSAPPSADFQKAIFTQSKTVIEEANWKMMRKNQENAEDKLFLDFTFEVALSNTPTNVNIQKVVLLVGDATGTASYIFGNGLNTGFSEVVELEKVFQSINDQTPPNSIASILSTYDHEVKQLVEKMQERAKNDKFDYWNSSMK